MPASHPGDGRQWTGNGSRGRVRCDLHHTVLASGRPLLLCAAGRDHRTASFCGYRRRTDSFRRRSRRRHGPAEWTRDEIEILTRIGCAIGTDIVGGNPAPRVQRRILADGVRLSRARQPVAARGGPCRNGPLRVAAQSPQSILGAHLDVGAGRVLERFELAVAGLARWAPRRPNIAKSSAPTTATRNRAPSWRL